MLTNLRWPGGVALLHSVRENPRSRRWRGGGAIWAEAQGYPRAEGVSVGSKLVLNACETSLEIGAVPADAAGA
ncbi:hypothetical protein D3C85_1604060 [compost metagenome]